VSVSWFVALALAGAASIEEPRACAIGAKPGPFALLDQRYLPRTLDEFAVDRALVLVFTTCECPLAGKAMPRIAELAATYRERGVRFALVNADPNETVADAATFALAHGVIVPVLDDPKMAAARALGVTHSPQVVVLDGSLTLRYRGRVDASTRVTGTAARAGRADLREAIDDVLANGKVRVAETPVEGCVLTLERPAPPATPVTWSQDVAPLMHRHCAECHHDGGQGPFALVAYEDVAKRAAMIAEVVRQKRMPPWFGTTGSEDFANHRGLEDREIRTLEAFAAQGAPVGDLDRAPPAPTFAPREWRIGEPDLVLTQLGRAELPASGIVPYHYTVFPHLFTEDTWVEAVEIKGANPRVLHHCNLAFYELGQKFKMENFITGLVPGGDPMDLDPGTAVLIPAGSVLGAEIHYVTSGKPEVDEVSVALRFPKTKVRKRLHCHQIADFRFAIPPGAEAHAVSASTHAEGRLARGRRVRPHASARTRHDVRREHAGRRARDAARGAELRLRVAAVLSLSARRQVLPGRHAHRRDGALRQLGVQRVQPRSVRDREVRPADDGRDDVRLLLLRRRSRGPCSRRRREERHAARLKERASAPVRPVVRGHGG
jgi:hypothetical protein